MIELSDEDEPEGSTPPVGAAPAALVISTAPAASAIPGSSTPCAFGWPDKSHDEEIARRLFIELNREAIGIPGDGGLVILGSDNDEEATEEEEVDEEEEEEVKDEPAGGRLSSRS